METGKWKLENRKPRIGTRKSRRVSIFELHRAALLSLGRRTRFPVCHSEPFACHSERSEESRQFAQGKLREEPRQLLFDLTTTEILRFAQNDRRRAQNDRRRAQNDRLFAFPFFDFPVSIFQFPFSSFDFRISHFVFRFSHFVFRLWPGGLLLPKTSAAFRM